MKTKLIVSIAILFVAVLIFYSCSDNSLEQNSSSSTFSKLEKSAVTDELSELIDIREEITQNVIDRKVDIGKLRDAYRNKDVNKIMTLMKMSKNEYNSYNKRLLQIREAIFKKYPNIKKAATELENNYCATCNSDKFFQNFEKYTHASTRQGNNLSKIYAGDGYDDVDCDWIQFTAGLVVCSTLGPFLYWPCAYVAICTFCTGGWVDDACI